MNRVYLMPKILILVMVTILLTKTTNLWFLLLIIIGSSLVVAIFEFLRLYLLGRFYIYQKNHNKPINQEKVYSIVHRYMKMVNHLMRVEVDVLGYEHFDPSKAYLITPNHQSNEDALVVMEAFKDPIAFAAKFPLSNVILVKDWMRLMGCEFLKKDDMRSQIMVMNDVASHLKAGKSFIIFPEGKRSYSPELNEFKAGTFKMATKTQVDILPVTLNHVHKFRHHFPWKKTHIDVYIHEPISYDVYKDLGTNEIADHVKTIIASKIEA
jgi:1-acyl-sn-glycerol-3-phosphate acyltransferase